MSKANGKTLKPIANKTKAPIQEESEVLQNNLYFWTK